MHVAGPLCVGHQFKLWVGERYETSLSRPGEGMVHGRDAGPIAPEALQELRSGASLDRPQSGRLQIAALCREAVTRVVLPTRAEPFVPSSLSISPE
jgi:hypothetical protein